MRRGDTEERFGASAVPLVLVASRLFVSPQRLFVSSPCLLPSSLRHFAWVAWLGVWVVRLCKWAARLGVSVTRLLGGAARAGLLAAALALHLSARVVGVCNALSLLEAGRPERGSAAKVGDVYRKHRASSRPFGRTPRTRR